MTRDVDSPGVANAEVPKVEVTPEMLAAAKETIGNVWSEFIECPEIFEETMASVYIAMTRARFSSVPEGS